MGERVGRGRAADRGRLLRIPVCFSISSRDELERGDLDARRPPRTCRHCGSLEDEALIPGRGRVPLAPGQGQIHSAATPPSEKPRARKQQPSPATRRFRTWRLRVSQEGRQGPARPGRESECRDRSSRHPSAPLNKLVEDFARQKQARPMDPTRSAARERSPSSRSSGAVATTAMRGGGSSCGMSLRDTDRLQSEEGR